MSYTLNRNDIYDFARSIGAVTRERGDELQFEACPYCHGGEHHDKWTFSINTASGAFKCLRSSCGQSGHFVELCRDNEYQLPDDKKEYKLPPQPTAPVKPRAAAIEYLNGRGISTAVLERYEVTTKADDSRVLAFLFRDAAGTVRFIKYRNTAFQKDITPGSKEWCEKGTEPILFGMYQARDYEKPLIITEGQIDSLSLAEAGVPNAVSVPIGMNGFGWIDSCREWVERFREIIVFGDCEEKDGKKTVTLADEISKRFEKKTVRTVRVEDFLFEKDANDILRKYGREALLTAVEKAAAPEARPDSMANFLDREFLKQTELYKADGGLSTGFKNLDNEQKGIRSGLYVIAAATSAGKTTFVLQMADHFAKSGRQVLYFSLEQTPFELLSKSINRMVAEANAEKQNNDSSVNTNTIREGNFTPAVYDAMCEYSESIAANMSIIKGNFDIDYTEVESQVEKYCNANRDANGDPARPVVVIDYLQILQPASTDGHQTAKDRVDKSVTALKRMSSKLGLPVFVISSVNRSSYTQPISMESLKESGGIEYSADVVWCLELQIFKNDLFTATQTTQYLKKKRDAIRKYKDETPRKIFLHCFKNRYGKSDYDCCFDYYPAQDRFHPGMEMNQPKLYKAKKGASDEDDE